MTAPILLLLMGWTTTAAQVGGYGERFDSPMYHDPRYVDSPVELRFRDRLLDLWLTALDRPESYLKTRSADAIAKAHSLGMSDAERAVKPLLEAFTAADADRLTRYACARALIALDAEEAAAAFHAAMPDAPLALAQLTEPALAKWNHSPAAAVWLERIQQPDYRVEYQSLAIDGLRMLKHADSIEPLRDLAANAEAPPRIRLDAAKAAAELAPESWIDLSRQLYAEGEADRLARMVATRLLMHSENSDNRQLLTAMSVDPEPAVAIIALRRLALLDRDRLLPMIDTLIGRRDAQVRQMAVVALAHQGEESSVARLVELTDDIHPAVRNDARDQLEKFVAADRHRDLILTTVSGILADRQTPDDWRIVEQSLLLIGHVDHKPAADSIVAHLDATREEVFVPAAWALRVLDVTETLPGMLDYATRVHEQYSQLGLSFSQDEQLSHLFQAFGTNKYRAAESLLVKFVPKQPQLGVFCRGAAVWALGHIYTGELNRELADAFVARINDRNPPPPQVAENTLVRRMCLIGLGRMGSEEYLDELRDAMRIDGAIGELGFAAAWSVNLLTGEPIPEAPTRIDYVGPWFLEPIESADD